MTTKTSTPRDPATPAPAPRTGANTPEQVKVWEDEGGSPPDQISSTESEPPRTTGAPGGTAKPTKAAKPD